MQLNVVDLGYLKPKIRSNNLSLKCQRLQRYWDYYKIWICGKTLFLCTSQKYKRSRYFLMEVTIFIYNLSKKWLIFNILIYHLVSSFSYFPFLFFSSSPFNFDLPSSILTFCTCRKEKKRVEKELLSTFKDESIIVLADWLKVNNIIVLKNG